MQEKTVASRHWTFWAIGLAGLLFNFLGCLNFVSQLDAQAVAAMPDAYRMIVDSRPVWGTGAFAVAVFGGAFGCLLLLFRQSVAIHVLVVSLVAAVAAQIPFIGMEGFPREAWIGWLGQLLVGVFLISYALMARAKGWIGT